MITALPPAYYRELTVEEGSLRPRGFSDDARLMEHVSIDTARHLFSTPGSFIPAENDDYEVPPPQSVVTKKVRFRYLGPGKPLPLDEDIDDQ